MRSVYLIVIVAIVASACYGLDWTEAGVPFDNDGTDQTVLQIDSSLYAVVCRYHKMSFYKSPDGAQWTKVRDSLRTPWTTDFASCAWQGSIILCGGDTAYAGGELHHTNKVWKIDTLGNCTRLADTATWKARAHHRLVPLESQNKLILLGGTGGDDYVYASTDSGKTWRQTCSAPWGTLEQFGTAVFGDSIWIFGGINRNGFSVTNSVWLSTDVGNSWSCVDSAAPWSPRASFGYTQTDTSIWMFGGRDTTYLFAGYLNEVWEYRVTERSWQKDTADSTADMWCARIWPSASYFRNKLFVCCGMKLTGGGGMFPNDLWYSNELSGIVEQHQPASPAVRILPNIIRDKAIIHLSPPRPTVLQVRDVLGRLVCTSSISVSPNTSTFVWQRPSWLRSGTYFICCGHDRFRVLLI